MRTERVIIYPKDIQRITGKSDRYGRSLLKRIRNHFQKEDHHLISVDEFCAYTGLKYELVISFLVA